MNVESFCNWPHDECEQNITTFISAQWQRDQLQSDYNIVSRIFIDILTSLLI